MSNHHDHHSADIETAGTAKAHRDAPWYVTLAYFLVMVTIIPTGVAATIGAFNSSSANNSSSATQREQLLVSKQNQDILQELQLTKDQVQQSSDEFYEQNLQDSQDNQLDNSCQIFLLVQLLKLRGYKGSLPKVRPESCASAPAANPASTTTTPRSTTSTATTTKPSTTSGNTSTTSTNHHASTTTTTAAGPPITLPVEG